MYIHLMDDINISVSDIEEMPLIGKITLFSLDDYYQRKSPAVDGTVFTEMNGHTIKFFVELNQYQHNKISLYNSDIIGGVVSLNNNTFMILNDITKESMERKKDIGNNMYTFSDVATIYGIPNVNKNRINVHYVSYEDKGNKNLYQIYWNMTIEQYNLWVACRNKVTELQLLNNKNDTDLMTKIMIHKIKRARI